MLRLAPEAVKTFERAMTCKRGDKDEPTATQIAAARDVIRKVLPDTVVMDIESRVEQKQDIVISFD